MSGKRARASFAVSLSVSPGGAVSASPHSSAHSCRQSPVPLGHRRPQRRPGLLRQRAQPLGRVQPGHPRVEPLVELVAHDPAGLRLQVDEAGRPGKGAGGGENPLMGLAPPGPGLRPAGQGIGQIPQRGIPRFPRPEVQHQRREIRLVRDCRPPLSQLPGTPLRVAADALAGHFASPGTPFLRCHPVSVAIRGSALPGACLCRRRAGGCGPGLADLGVPVSMRA